MLTTNEQILVPKGWGFEKWIVNSPTYCGKLLYIVKGKSCSWHYHVTKDETFFIQSGEVLLRFGETDDISTSEAIILKRGDSFHVPPGMRHQMTAIEETELFEFSTMHVESDSIRVTKGD